MARHTKFSELVKHARGGQSQKELAASLHLDQPALSRAINAQSAPSPDLLVRISDKLKTPLDATLLAGLAAHFEYKASTAKDAGDAANWRRGGDALLDVLERLPPMAAASSEFAHLSLADFPFDRPWSVIAGDRREQPPRDFADLIALSASTCDLMYLPGLGLPTTTTVRSDKALKLARNLEQHMSGNLLVVGSPAVSLATREIFRRVGATFLFNIGESAYAAERAIYDKVADKDQFNPAELSHIQRTESAEIERILGEFREPGFVDPVRFKGIRSDRTFGIVALAPNPWSPEHLVCICAGVRGAATAGAVRLLSDRSSFVDHPWGGVLDVTEASSAVWEIRFDHLNPRWLTPAYTSAGYLKDLDTLIDSVRASESHDVKVSGDLLDQVRAFGARLEEGFWS